MNGVYRVNEYFFTSIIVVTGTSASNTSTGGTNTNDRVDSNDLVVAVVGAALAISILVVLPVSVALSCCGMWCLITRKKNNPRKRAVYEEPDSVIAPAIDVAIPLSDNQAYSQVSRHHSRN